MKLFILLFLYGCLGGDHNNGERLKVSSKIAAKNPYQIFKDVYVPTLIDNFDCSEGKSLWFTNSGLDYEDLKEQIPDTENILKAFDLTLPRVTSSNHLEEQYERILDEKSGQNESRADRCLKIAKDLLSLKLSTSISYFLEKHLQQLHAASIEARKNLQLGSRFNTAIDQSLSNEVKQACQDVKMLSESLQMGLRTNIKECFTIAYGSDIWTNTEAAIFGCEKFGSILCVVAERIFK